jgi:hypothetical protein
MVVMGAALWSPAANACGTGGLGAGARMGVAQALLVVFGLSLISLLSLRAASRAFSRMREGRPGPGMKAAHVAATGGYVVSVVGTVLSGGLLLALLLL